MTPRREAFEIADTTVESGKRARVKIPVARFTTGDWSSLTVEVLHGRRPGPVIWLSGSVHGDELDGAEIVRRISEQLRPSRMSGTVLGIPVVNVFGFTAESRYLPDRRDLNRSFPGRRLGSMAAQLAHLFMTSVVERCTVGLDYHCGSDGRENLPQIRADLTDPSTVYLAAAFGAPVSIDGKGPKGSLRQAAVKVGARILVYEGGEAGRFTESSIRAGVDGGLRVLALLGMIDNAPVPTPTTLVTKSHWVRAPRSGVARVTVDLGQEVQGKEVLGDVSELLGAGPRRFRAKKSGIVIGRRVNPIVYRGDALVHVAEVE